MSAPLPTIGCECATCVELRKSVQQSKPFVPFVTTPQTVPLQYEWRCLVCGQIATQYGHVHRCTVMTEARQNP